MNFCGSCGARVQSGDRFCIGCGAVLVAPTATATATATRVSSAPELAPLAAAKHTNTVALITGAAAIALVSGGLTVMLMR